MAGNDDENNCSSFDEECAVYGNTAIVTNRWNHLAVTKDNATVRFYNDGSYTNSGSLPVSSINYDDGDDSKYAYLGTARG